MGQLQREGSERETRVQRDRRCRIRRRPDRRRGVGGRGGRRRDREQLGMEGEISMLPKRRDTQSGHKLYLDLFSAGYLHRNSKDPYKCVQ